MAERTKTYLECDNALCRKRKGVARVKVSIERPGADVAVITEEGELCAYHLKALMNHVSGMFINSKPAN